MKRIKYYSHEIYTVLTMLLILVSALFVSPSDMQKSALVYAFLFLLHEWEENNYPGGFFDMLFGEIAHIEPVPSGNKLREARTFVYILLIVLTFTPYIFHTHIWLILPILYLGLVEGLMHSIIMPKLFKLNRSYTPGMVTALCQFAFSIYTLYYVIDDHRIVAWQYIVAVPILLAGLAFMAINGMRTNGINPREMPKTMIKNLKALYGKYGV